MCISTKQAAKHLCKKTNWELTLLELQHMLYLSNMGYLATTGDVLVDEKFQASKYGPICPSLHHSFIQYGNDFIPKTAFGWFDRDLNEEKHSREITILSKVAESFSPPSLGKLVDVTHREGSAWKKNYNPSVKKQIPKQHILKEYQTLTKDYTNVEAA